MDVVGCTSLLVHISLILAATYLLFWAFKRKHPEAPPCIGSWIPWIGASFRFGKAPLEFIEQARAQYGAVFTVVTVGKRLTFVTEEEDIELFFKSKNVDFQEAVQEAVWRTASISRKSFTRSHMAVHDMIKWRLAPSRLHLFCSNLSKEFNECLMHLGTKGTDDLYDLVWDWSKSKHWLLSLFESIVAKDGKVKPTDDDSKTLLQHLLDTLDGNCTANYSLLMLWASQANALPITFWTLAFIISSPLVYKTIMKELCSFFNNQANKKIEMEVADLQKLPYLKCCIIETLRLRAPGVITRKVMQPLKIKNYIIPSGDMLMLSLYWAHRNPKYFPEPEKFLPDRWKDAVTERQVFLDGFMAFGGGRYQCPGRWFALMEIQMFAALMLYKYEFTLLDPVPKESPFHLVGTQQPLGPCKIMCMFKVITTEQQFDNGKRQSCSARGLVKTVRKFGRNGSIWHFSKQSSSYNMRIGKRRENGLRTPSNTTFEMQHHKQGWSMWITTLYTLIATMQSSYMGMTNEIIHNWNSATHKPRNSVWDNILSYMDVFIQSSILSQLDTMHVELGSGQHTPSNLQPLAQLSLKLPLLQSPHF
ncbi:24-hydroxycholesterol 7-alpha-hydroxylase isoform X3 [Mobula birostris]|uniref:24-hydroxycholesterol 7-alpha-hydroxylase isoform X3 n=1 Tax=Mobula birostris TaxID=1983395 RepID=UPI003B27F98A